jgi:hypothetical protein
MLSRQATVFQLNLRSSVGLRYHFAPHSNLDRMSLLWPRLDVALTTQRTETVAPDGAPRPEVGNRLLGQ